MINFGSWFKAHIKKPNPQTLAGALTTAKMVIDQLSTVENWPWVKEFDPAAETAITALENWQPGDSTTEINESLQAAMKVLNGVTGVSDKDKTAITAFIGTAQLALGFIDFKSS